MLLSCLIFITIYLPKPSREAMHAFSPSPTSIDAMAETRDGENCIFLALHAYEYISYPLGQFSGRVNITNRHAVTQKTWRRRRETDRSLPFCGLDGHVVNVSQNMFLAFFLNKPWEVFCETVGKRMMHPF